MDADFWLHLTSVLLAPLVIGAFFLLIETRRERSRELTQLYSRYYSEELIRARRKSWDFFRNTYWSDPRPWAEFHLPGKGHERARLHEARESLHLVGSVFYLLMVFIEENRVDRHLAARVFGWQWTGWTPSFRLLRDVSLRDGSEYPRWLDCVDSLDSLLLPDGPPSAIWQPPTSD